MKAIDDETLSKLKAQATAESNGRALRGIISKLKNSDEISDHDLHNFFQKLIRWFREDIRNNTADIVDKTKICRSSLFMYIKGENLPKTRSIQLKKLSIIDDSIAKEISNIKKRMVRCVQNHADNGTVVNNKNIIDIVHNYRMEKCAQPHTSNTI